MTLNKKTMNRKNRKNKKSTHELMMESIHQLIMLFVLQFGRGYYQGTVKCPLCTKQFIQVPNNVLKILPPSCALITSLSFMSICSITSLHSFHFRLRSKWGEWWKERKEKKRWSVIKGREKRKERIQGNDRRKWKVIPLYHFSLSMIFPFITYLPFERKWGNVE